MPTLHETIAAQQHFQNVPAISETGNWRSGRIGISSPEHRGVEEFNAGGAVRQNSPSPLVFVGIVSRGNILVVDGGVVSL